MKIRVFIVASAICATTAFAGNTHYVATLAQPLAAKKVIVANNNLWRCDGTTCVLTSEPIDAGSVRSCRELQRQAGALVAYGAEGKPFDADKLANCNGHS